MYGSRKGKSRKDQHPYVCMEENNLKILLALYIRLEFTTAPLTIFFGAFCNHGPQPQGIVIENALGRVGVIFFINVG